MNQNKMASDKNIGKISFFENIYYWIWYYLDKVIPKSGASPHIAACALLTVFRMLNVFFVIGSLSALSKINILKELMNTDDILEMKFIIIPIVLLFGWLDERRYERRVDIIIDKFDDIESEERKKKKRIFLSYILGTIITVCMFPWLLSFYAA